MNEKKMANVVSSQALSIGHSLDQSSDVVEEYT